MGGAKSQSEDFEKTREQIHRQMLSAVSHDLKTPLATMIGSLEIFTRMEDKLSPEKKAMLINSALGEAYRLDNFITNILDMAKLEGGMVAIKRERVDMKSLVNDCITRLGPRGKTANIKLQPRNDTGIVTTDPMMFGRALGLLLDNALKHAGKTPEIIVSFGRAEDELMVQVCDNGTGIPAGKETEIFSKYTRFSRNDQQNAGTGLGLAICQQIMQLLSGSVTVHNLESGGACFTLRCPSHP